MAVNISRCAAALESGIRSALSLGSTPYPQLTAHCTATVTAILEEIINHAEIINGKANGLTDVPIAVPGPDQNKSPITNVPVTGGIA